jgi:hypothetical protein
VLQAFRVIVDAARARQPVLNLNTMESRIGRPPWRDLLKDVRHGRGWFAAAIGDKSVRRGLTSLEMRQ